MDMVGQQAVIPQGRDPRNAVFEAMQNFVPAVADGTDGGCRRYDNPSIHE
jgi:hypothetical protein